MEPHDREEKRPLIQMENLLSSALVLGELGEKTDAVRFLTQARELSREADLDDIFSKSAGRVVRLLEG